MSATSGGAGPQPKQKGRAVSGWRQVRNAGILLVIAWLAGHIADLLFSQRAPGIFDWLGPILLLQGNRPLWVHIVGWAGLALVVGGLGWLSYRLWRANQDEESADAGQAQPAGPQTVISGTGAQVTIYQGVAPPAQATTPPAPQPAANVSAPAGMPSAVSFVGRDKERKELLDQLQAGASAGVFALAGMGGVGKTALAAEVVTTLARDTQTFPGGAAWIACEDAQGAEGLADLWTRVARALNLDQIATLPDAEQRRAALQSALAQGPKRLLALDNIDGLDAGAILDALAIQGHTALLLTARQRVLPHRLHALDLHPLEQPDAHALFLQRLHENDAARPTPADEAALDDLLERLGGLPLALELTAAYAALNGLTLRSVLDEIKHDGLKAAALQGETPQQQAQRALQARFDRSWQRLSPAQQGCFAGLSLLEGSSFPRQAALALAEASSKEVAPGEAPSTPAAALAALLRYALVERLPEERQRLHPLLRAYAGQQLAALPPEQQERLGAAMFTFWLDYAEANPGYKGMDALEAEAPGLLGALTWAHDHAHHRELLSLARAIGTAWDVRGRRDEELRVYAWTIQAASGLDDLKEQRWATHQLATTQAQTGRLEEARQGYEQALALAQQVGDPSAERRERHGLAVLDGQAGRLEEARQGYEQALALARESGDPSAERDERHALAVLDGQAGRLEEARQGYEQALALARELGDPEAEATELRDLGNLARAQGKLDQARSLIQQALALGTRLGNPQLIGECHQFLAWVEGDAGNREEAIAHDLEALRLFKQLQSPDAEDARDHLRELGMEDIPE